MALRVEPAEDHLHQDRLDAVKSERGMPTLSVEWEDAPETVWPLRLFENFGDADSRWSLQPDVSWERVTEDRLSYGPSPVAQSPEIPLTVAVELSVREDQIDFTADLHNPGPGDVECCYGWVCFIHRWAQAFQANCEIAAGNRAESYENPCCLPVTHGVERWRKMCAIRGKEHRTENLYHIRNSAAFQPHVLARDGAVRAWRVPDSGTRQIVRLVSPDACLVGWSHWPCTDLALHFGDLSSGTTQTVSGTLVVEQRSYTPI